MRKWIFIFVLGWFSYASAMETILEISWNTPNSQIQIASHSRSSDGNILSVSGDANAVEILSIQNSSLNQDGYAIVGFIRYENIQGSGYLELLNYFAENQVFFSKTLGTGPMGKIEGSCGWRYFALPFYMKSSPDAVNKVGFPEKLVLNLHLSKGNTIELKNLRLLQFKIGENPLEDPSGWWSSSEAGMYGGVLGTIIGILGALIGYLCNKGQAKTLVLGIVIFSIVSGITLMGIAGYAWLAEQPYHVYFIPLLSGFILTAVFGFNYRHINRAYNLKNAK